MALSKDIHTNINNFKKALNADKSFDLIYRTFVINKRTACIFFVDGLIKDEVMEKILEYFYSLTDDSFFKDAHTFSKNCVPYVEVDVSDDKEKIETAVLSGVTAMFIDGMDSAILLDLRTYPQRDTGEPEKDKVLRGSKDSFVETVVFNTALIRRRIRSGKLIMKSFSTGSVSKSDIVLCYMEDKADMKFVEDLSKKIENLNVQMLSMNVESLVEGLYKRAWYNPFPKVKYTERPDTAASSVFEGNVVVLVDNSPQAIVMPTSIFDVMDEADDYYFPPITGTYLRLTRYLVSLLTVLLTPVWILAINHPEFVPDVFSFILLSEQPSGLPIFWQLIILEIMFDGLRLASLNTPDALTTSLSIIAAIALSEFAVDVGWFCAEAMLYVAFVAIANYTQPNFELGYCLKFARILLLVLCVTLDIWGFALGLVLIFVFMLTNKTISGKSYLYPLIPFNGKELKNKIFRTNIYLQGKK